ncbi:MAG: hypothetical protein JW874_02170 [Spirochaetales bacterium]|nr:hypothetical protein [Spirochaetales bacterium]
MKVSEPMQEYNAFGPWVYELNAEHHLPPQFEGHIVDADSALMIIKIPVHMERRDLRPGMLMYDQLVCVYNDRLYYAQYRGHRIESRTVGFDDIIALENSVSLLAGKFTVFTGSGTFSFEYNTVSLPVISRLAGLIRERVPRKEVSLLNSGPVREEDLDFFFQGQWHKLQNSEDGFSLLAWQPGMALSYCRRNLFMQLKETFTRPVLVPSLHLFSSTELLVITRLKPVLKRSDDSNGYRLIFIPLCRIDGIDVRDSEEYSGVQGFIIHAGRHSFSLLTGSGREEFMYCSQFAKKQ